MNGQEGFFAEESSEDTSNREHRSNLLEYGRIALQFCVRVFVRPLGLAKVSFTGALLAMAVVGVWSLFAVLHYLPWEFRCVVMWTLLLALFTLAASVNQNH